MSGTGAPLVVVEQRATPMSDADVPGALARCQAWCEANGKVFSKRRAVNSLNRDAADRPSGPAARVVPLLDRRTAGNFEAARRAIARTAGEDA